MQFAAQAQGGPQRHRSAAEDLPCGTPQTHQHQPHHQAQAAEGEDGGRRLAELSDGLHGGAGPTHRSPSIKEWAMRGAASAERREGGSFFSASESLIHTFITPPGSGSALLGGFREAREEES